MRLTMPISVFLILFPQGLVLGAAKLNPTGDAPRVFCLNPQALVKVKTRVAAGDETLKPAMDKLLAEADIALKAGPFSVTIDPLSPPSGDKHDYMSFGLYWWPDPKTKDGLPYVRRDGEVNRETRNKSDVLNLHKMISSVDTLALAYYLTGKEIYARQAKRLLRVWFLQSSTKMNPHLKYGQAIPGVCEGRGIGIIDTRDLPKIVDAVGLLASSKAWTTKDQQGMVAWFDAYLEWQRTSDNGKQIKGASNNIGTWFDVQKVSFALFVDKEDLARKIIETSKWRRVESQIKPDGRQPEELARTNSFTYSTMNLHAMFKLAEMGERIGIDLWRHETQDGRGIRVALDYLVPYADPAKTWPHQQISPIEHIRPLLLLPLLRQASTAYGDDRYEKLIKRFPEKFVTNHRMQLLYPNAANATLGK